MVSLQENREFLLILPDEQNSDLANEVQKLLDIDTKNSGCEYIVSNSNENSLIYAPEINWYIKNSNDNIETQAKTIADIYAFRSERFDKNNAPILNENGDTPYISYKSSSCNYSNRFLDDVCTKCVDVCESNALHANSATKNIDFNPSLCVKCGSCIGICPTGALESYEFKSEVFETLFKYIANKKVVVATKDFIANNDYALPQNTFVLLLESYKELTEENLLSIAMQSGNQLLILGCEDSAKISLANSITNAIFGKKCVIFDSAEYVEFNEIAKDITLGDMRKFSLFANRVKTLADGGDFGEIKTDLNYGEIKIDDAKCTLCMGCAEVCKTGALKADENSFSLYHNPSLCTACGYCASTCSEKCIENDFGKIELNPNWFEFKKVATDSLFHCVECGKPFASSKAIAKVTSVFFDLFTDERKRRTLMCCADCKPKLMLHELVKDRG